MPDVGLSEPYTAVRREHGVGFDRDDRRRENPAREPRVNERNSEGRVCGSLSSLARLVRASIGVARGTAAFSRITLGKSKCVACIIQIE
jgi:hypothetical protein